MPSLAATSFKNQLVPKKLRSNWSNPFQKLIVIKFVVLSKVLPLPAKVFSGCSLPFTNHFTSYEARYATQNPKLALARITREQSFHYLLPLDSGSLTDHQVSSAGGTTQVV